MSSLCSVLITLSLLFIFPCQCASAGIGAQRFETILKDFRHYKKIKSYERV
jgi:hypothetical protein